MAELTGQLERKSSQVEELGWTVERLQQDRALLKMDLEVSKERLLAVRQNVAELESKLDGEASLLKIQHLCCYLSLRLFVATISK